MDIVPAPSVLSTEDPRYLNRELSWLDFNGRVLALAEDPGTPLLERAKFLGIFGQNLDEFFQVRVSGLKEQASAGVGVATPEGMTPREQLSAIRERVAEQVDRAGALLTEEICPPSTRPASGSSPGTSWTTTTGPRWTVSSASGSSRC